MKEADRLIKLNPDLARHADEIRHSLHKALKPIVGQMRFAGLHRGGPLGVHQKLEQFSKVLSKIISPTHAALENTFKFSVREDFQDLIDLTFPDRTTERNVAANRLATRVSAFLADPAARTALYELAMSKENEPGTLLREWLLPAGFILAATDIDRLQKIRLGKDWVLGQDGKIVELRPTELLFYEFAQWLYQEARNACEATLLDKTYPRTPKDPLDLPNELDSLSPQDDKETVVKEEVLTKATLKYEDPTLYELYARDTREEARTMVSNLLRKASPQERSIIARALMDEENGLIDVLVNDGHNSVAIRKFRERLRKKLLN